ncbi:hypothetical protein KTT_50170 [Tengunoibacter tsumagoiensis]|uniref:Uncharacterized protein n=1 Tax=Tengunoibacter tsumagoiensis TaxID=2014871 RepID=A0A402A7V5_9CHLR|nr:hypothetical protein KTT_50170 [Tengunoibacter tsumagoiensis]
MPPLGQIEQLARAGNGTRSVGIRWTNWPISREMSLDGDGINGKKHWPGLRQMDKHRLVSRNMSTGLDEFEARKQLGVAINQLISRGWLIPLGTGERKTGMTGMRYFILSALCNELGIGEGSMIAGVIIVVVCTNEEIYVRSLHTYHCQLFNNALPVFYSLNPRCVWQWLEVWGKAAINQNVFAISGLNEIAGNR